MFLVLIRFVLRDMAAEATEILSPIPDTMVIRDPIAVPVHVYTIPDYVEDQIKMVFGNDSTDAIKVAKCESGLNPKARNGQSTATGVFQIMASVHGVSRTRLENPMVNILIAKELFDGTGENWRHWRASINCHGLE